MADQAAAPIIIKRIKKGGHGHHGGAWKVAYADFVTAMMAFFLLLWLINVTSPEQKMGLAEYFMPTIGIKDAQGIGFKGGQKPTTQRGRANQDTTAPGLVVGKLLQGPVTQAPDTPVSKPDPDAESSSINQKSVHDPQIESTDVEMFKTTTEDIKQAMEQDPTLQSYKNNVIIDNTPEGLRIDMIDDVKKPMFIPGTATLTEIGKKILDSMAAIVLKTPNNVMLKGHTDASGNTANPQYTNWELSADRANAARRFLLSTQLEPGRVMKVVGLADRELLNPQEPASPRNRRVSLVLIRGSYYRDPKSEAGGPGILSVTDPKPPKPVEKKAVVIEPEKKPEAPISGSSIFNPTPKLEKPGIAIKDMKAPTEERPELNLPTPKPQPIQKKIEVPVIEDKEEENISGDSIFNPTAPNNKPVRLKENRDSPEARPELHLPAPKLESAKKPRGDDEAIPKSTQDIGKGTGLFEPTAPSDDDTELPVNGDIPAVLELNR